MSALNHFLFDDGAVLMTDAASNVEGVLTRIGSKVHRFPHLNAAAGCTGTSFVSPIVQDFLGRTAMTFDRLIADMPAEVAEGLAYFAPQLRERGEEGLSDIVVVGFSESGREWQAWECTFDLHQPPAVRRLPRASLRPWTPEMADDLRKAGLTIDAALADGTQVAQRAAPIMEIQRRRAAPHGCAIGGFQEMTALQPALTMSAIVTVWPDRLGEPVNLS